MAESWSRDECIVVLNLYVNGEDYSQDASDDTVQEVAGTIGRSSAAVGMRLANYRSVDPASTTGLTNISKVAKSVWQDYHDSPEELRWEADRARDRLRGDVDTGESGGDVDTGETSARRAAQVGQREFRRGVLEKYGEECILCDVDHPGLLVAGHILPWSENEEERGNPKNSLVLCENHHEAFDLGLFTITEDLEIAVDPDLDTASKFLKETVVGRDGERVDFGDFEPSAEFLAEWNERYDW